MGPRRPSYNTVRHSKYHSPVDNENDIQKDSFPLSKEEDTSIEKENKPKEHEHESVVEFTKAECTSSSENIKCEVNMVLSDIVGFVEENSSKERFENK